MFCPACGNEMNEQSLPGGGTGYDFIRGMTSLKVLRCPDCGNLYFCTFPVGEKTRLEFQLTFVTDFKEGD